MYWRCFMIVTVLLQLAPVLVAGQAQTAPGQAEATPPDPTPWGEPDLQGIWTTDYQIPLQRPARFADQEFFTDEERAALDRERADINYRDPRSERGSEQDVGGAYNRAIYLTYKHTGRRTSLIVDPPDGRIPSFTPEAQKRRADLREYQLALLQATNTCKNNLRGCAGGQYGPPSPRRAETPPHYLTSNVNRADGPEDRSLGERCMSARLPDFGGAAGFFLQVVQSPGTVSIFYDTGQGQGWQRTIPVTERPHLPSHVRQWWGDSRGRWDGNTLVVDVTNFSPKTDFQGVPREPASHRTLDTPRRGDDRVYRHDGGPDDLDATVDRRARTEPAKQRSESNLQGAPLSRGELRHAGVARRRSRPGAGVCRRPGSGSGHHVHGWMWIWI